MQNVSRSETPINAFNYNDADIIEKIKKDFFSMCYLCEEFVPKHYNIDHFFPQMHYEHLTHSWENLFFCCGKCNGVKPKIINTCSPVLHDETPQLSSTNNSVLDSTIEEEDVESIIQLEYDFTNDRVIISINPIGLVPLQINKAKNTKELLERIYNGINSSSRQYLNLRSEIKESIASFKHDIDVLKNIIPSLQPATEEKIKSHLNKKYKKKESSYFSFKRTIVRTNPLYANLSGYIQ